MTGGRDGVGGAGADCNDGGRGGAAADPASGAGTGASAHAVGGQDGGPGDSTWSGPDGRPGAGRSDEPADGAFHLFVYGTLRSDGGASGVLEGSRLLGRATVDGTLYDLGEYPALMLYGGTPVEGEIWRCPAPLLPKLDEYEGVDRGLFRRVAVLAGEVPCWTYVAGPQLGQRLTSDRRLIEGRWAWGGRPAG